MQAVKGHQEAERMLKLPHPELVELLIPIKRSVIAERHSTVVSTELSYAVFRPEPDMPYRGACYDEDGTIYVPEDYVRSDEQYVDLIAFHEHVEIQQKLAGRSHAHAHRRAYVEELLAAKAIFEEPTAFRRYLSSRISGYPEEKIPDPEKVVARLEGVIKDERPRKGKLLQVIKEHRL